jgi:hypothetical protein
VRQIRITVGEITLCAELNDSETASRIWEALPLAGRGNVWGQEIYFRVAVEAEEAPDARTRMAVGELAFWPVGNAFCIFFGPTPVSEGAEPRAYSPVNVFGRVTDDPAPLKRVPDGAPVRVERAE